MFERKVELEIREEASGCHWVGFGCGLRMDLDIASQSIDTDTDTETETTRSARNKQHSK